jgi:hypothetical protein
MTGRNVNASSSCEDLADWLKLQALGDASHTSSVTDLARELHRSGTLETLDETEESSEGDEEGMRIEYASDPRSERSEAICSDAFNEVERRRDACVGGLGVSAYPFAIQERSISLEREGARTVYTFLLLLSVHGKDAGPKGVNAAKLFEEVCAAASRVYLGGPRAVARAMVFGHPRSGPPKSFRDAVDTLCKELGEGEGCRSVRAVEEKKDAKLDLVAWRPFSDRRPSQLITFGQCATGRQWREKQTELQPKTWCALWLNRTLYVDPVKTFFVPHQLEESTWEETSRFAGIVLDRCRIVSLCSEIDDPIKKQCAVWSEHVLRAGAVP